MGGTERNLGGTKMLAIVIAVLNLVIAVLELAKTASGY